MPRFLDSILCRHDRATFFVIHGNSSEMTKTRNGGRQKDTHTHKPLYEHAGNTQLQMTTNGVQQLRATGKIKALRQTFKKG